MKFLNPMANAVRALCMDAVEKAQSGHPGAPLATHRTVRESATRRVVHRSGTRRPHQDRERVFENSRRTASDAARSTESRG